MRTVKWIDVKPEILQTKTEDAEKQTVPAPEIQSTPRPTKRKVVETEVEAEEATEVEAVEVEVTAEAAE